MSDRLHLDDADFDEEDENADISGMSDNEKRLHFARLLAKKMSDISEKHYFAGWMDGLEHALQRAVRLYKAGKGLMHYGYYVITEDDIKELIRLSEACEGWIYWHEDFYQTYISIYDWVLMYEPSAEDGW